MVNLENFDPENMSTAQAVSYLGVTRRTLERYVQNGLLPKYQTLAPKRIHYRKEDLDTLRDGSPSQWDGVRLPIMVRHFDQWAIEQGYTPVSEFLNKPSFEPLPKDIAERMEIEVGTPAIHRVLLQSIIVKEKVKRYRISDNYYNPFLTSEQILQRMTIDPKFDTMEAIRMETGKSVIKHYTEIIARPSNLREQQFLKISRTTPILQATGKNVSKDGTVIFVNRRCFVGDMAELTIEEEVPYWK